MANSRHIENSEKSPYLSNGWTNRHQISQVYAYWPS